MATFKALLNIPRVLKNEHGPRPVETTTVTLLAVNTVWQTVRLRIVGRTTREDDWALGEEVCVRVGGQTVTLAPERIAPVEAALSPNGRSTMVCSFVVRQGHITNVCDEAPAKKPAAQTKSKPQAAHPTTLTSFKIRGLITGNVVTLWDHHYNDQSGTDVKVDNVDYDSSNPQNSRVTITRMSRGTSVVMGVGDTMDVLIRTKKGVDGTRARLTLEQVYGSAMGKGGSMHFICMLRIDNVTQCSSDGSYCTVHDVP